MRGAVTNKLEASFVNSLFVNHRRLGQLHDEIGTPPAIRTRRQCKTSIALQFLRRSTVVEPPNQRVHFVYFEIKATIAVVVDFRRNERSVDGDGL